MHKRSHTPTTKPLAGAINKGLGRPSDGQGFTLIEMLLVIAGSTLLASGGFYFYQTVSNTRNVTQEQSNVQAISQNADRVYGAVGNYQGLTITEAITKHIPPTAMVSSGGLVSRWSQPIVLEPAAVNGRTNAGLKITYQAVPARACAQFVKSASEGMVDVRVGNVSVLSDGKLDTGSMISRCKDGANVEFTYYSGATGLAGNVLDPVNLPSPPPTSVPPPASPPPAPPPVVVTPPATPGCGAAPTTPATGTTPAGQTCSFIWNSVAAPACWAPLALCVPTAPTIPGAPPPSTPPPVVTPPVSPPTSTPACVVPTPSTKLCATGSCVDGTPGKVDTADSGTFSCPAGQLISTPGAYLYASSAPRTRTQTVTRNETASCPDPFGAVRWNASSTNPATYSPWNETYSCANVCVAGAPLNESQAGPTLSAPGADVSRTLGCPAGQTGSITQVSSSVIYSGSIQYRTTTYSCPAPIGAAQGNTSAWGAPQATGWGAPQAVGNWTTVSNTCVAALQLTASCAFNGGQYTEAGTSWNGGCLQSGAFYMTSSRPITPYFYLTTSIDQGQYSISWSGACSGSGVSCSAPSRSVSVNSPFDSSATVTVTNRSTGQQFTQTINGQFRVSGIDKGGFGGN